MEFHWDTTWISHYQKSIGLSLILFIYITAIIEGIPLKTRCFNQTVILSDLNGTIINQNTYHTTNLKQVPTTIHSGFDVYGGAYDPIDMTGPIYLFLEIMWYRLKFLSTTSIIPLHLGVKILQ